MSALFDLTDYQQPTHACAGAVCQVCANQARPELPRVKKDPRWWHEAHDFVTQLAAGAQFTADDLVELIGLPDGSPNQVGACVRSWAASDLIVPAGYVESKRKSNHGRVVRVWRKA